MTEPTYQAARAVSAAVEARFLHHHTVAQQQNRQGLAPCVDARTVEAMVDVAFWASLLREEGRFPKISLAFLPPEMAGATLSFGRQLPLSADALTRLAPAVERPGIHLGVWREADELYVWGAIRTIPDLCFVLEVVEPGLLVIKYSRGEAFGKFGNVAVLKGDEIKLVDDRSIEKPGCPALLAWLVGQSANVRPEETDVLAQLAVSMRTHGHGGILLVVPGGSRRWQRSIVSPIPYSIVPPFTRLAELMQQEPDEKCSLTWQQAVRNAVAGIAGLTAVDGATVMNERYELLAFGAKIKRVAKSKPLERLVVTEPVVGSKAVVADPGLIGGTRHLSAAQFVHDQRDALALVASQDGPFTIFVWNASDDVVHAHRIETLLL